ncbi:uncharacterized protein K02A2.6-like [Planococcus citri]|uniref:uncharacterized protein K02A2.6-like n=1 Tax=Planococcus citri TaxID=170843 RepID=UPI0031F7D018
MTAVKQKPPPFEKFNSKEEDFTSWSERFSMHLESYDVAADAKVRFLIASMGPEPYAALKRLTFPKLPKEETFDDLIKHLTGYYDPKSLKEVSQVEFRRCLQHANENFASYHAALKEIAAGCDFGTRLDEEICGQITAGIYDSRLQKQLLGVSGLTLTKATELAKTFELATSSYDAIHENSPSTSAEIKSESQSQVNKINDQVSKKKYKPPWKQPNQTPPNQNKHPESDKSNINVCFRCGCKNHHATVCRFANSICNTCNKVGHLSSVCGKDHAAIRAAAFARKKKSSVKNVCASMSVVDINKVSAVLSCSAESDSEKPLPKIFINVVINSSVNVKFEANCGSDFSFMSLDNCRKFGLDAKLQPANRVFEPYDHGIIELVGIVPVKVRFKNVTSDQRLRIVDGNYATIMGRDWLIPFNIDIRSHVTGKIQQMTTTDDSKLLQQIEKQMEEYSDIFVEQVGEVPGVLIDVPLQPNAVPVFCKARLVPYALQSKVNDEIDRLVATGIYTPTTTSKWATPVVPVLKSNGSIRLVGDYNVSVNRCCVQKIYPIPNVEEILLDFSGCTLFSKFDIYEAYNHLKNSKAAAEIMAVNTQKGVFLVNRSAQGYTNVPVDFQGNMDQWVKDGLHKTSEKVDAILKVKRPENAEELKSFAGLVGYYSKFIPNCSDLFQPLSNSQKNFVWTKECNDAFQKIKSEIASDRVLCHFDPKKKLVLATDASLYALGAVLSHVDEQGERPIAFASRKLTPTEARYSQIDRESLGIYWGVKKFFNYLYGRKFELLADCQPLQLIFNATASKPSLYATRLLHYALFLQGFNYTIKYRNTKAHSNADFPSRFPVTMGNPKQIEVPTHIHQLQLQMLPVTGTQIASETKKDATISSLYSQLISEEPVRNVRNIQEYSLHKGCVFRGERVYIPPPLCKQILDELHLGHLGIVKCRQLARSYVYWPGIDKDIQNLIASCKDCSDNSRNPPRIAPHPWVPTDGPWQRIHFNCGQIEGRQLFIIVDSYSRWVECYVLNSISAPKLLECLDDCFLRFGLPII